MATPVEEFQNALFEGDISRAEEMLAADPSLSGRYNENAFGASAMGEAASGGHTEAVDLLLRHGVSPDQGSDWWAGSFSPLIRAVQCGDGPMVRHLIAAGATVGAYEAAAMGDLDRLHSIVAADPAAVQMRGGDGQQPLHVAANPPTAELLLDHGADIEAMCVDHESTPLHYANTRPSVAMALLERGAVGDVYAFSAVPDTRWLAASVAADPTVAALPFRPADFPCRGDVLNIYTFILGEGAQPVHVAAMRGNTAGLELLVEHGADPNARGGYDDATPLHGAAWNDAAASIPVLAGLGADLDAPSGAIHSNSALGWAIAGGSLAAVEALIAAGATVREEFVAGAQAGAAGAFQRLKRVPVSDREAIASAVLAAR